MNTTSLCLVLSLALLACNAAPKQQAGAETRNAILETQSVKPGINKRFKDPEMNVARAMKMFEGESREIFVEKVQIAKALELRAGEAVADIGSGTGLFLPYFSKEVGRSGKVYAVEISPRFIEHIQKLAKQKHWTQVQTVFCTDKSCELGPASVDAAFICDTYHHFEYPRTTMASLHRAMRPGARLVIVDFERIPGKSRKWILGHVRCDKQTVIEEVTAAGFDYVDELQLKGLEENYLIRFKRR